MKKIEFKNLPDKTTPINSTNLNKIQDNIEEVFEGNESMGSIVVEDITCKNLCNGISQGYYLTNAGTSFGRTATNNGLVIEVEENTDYTISTTDIQTRYRIAFTNTLLSIGGSSSDTYNALTKDGTKESITRNSGAYKYLIVNATDLLKIQVEKGNKATDYTSHKKFGYNSTDSMGEIIVDDITCKNILPNNIQSQAINGVTITRNNDGSLTFNGTTSAYTKLTIVSNLKLDSGAYTFYFAEEGTVSGNCFGAIRDENSSVVGKDLQIHNSVSINSFSLTEAKQVTITIALGTNTTVTNFKIYPMLEKGSVATGYVEHKEFSNKQIYSTEEQVIGTWIDGKPLYRKVFIANVDSDMETGSKVITNIGNVRTKRYESFFANNDNPGAVEGGTRFSDTDQVWCYITTGGEIKARVYGSTYVGRTLIVIVEYTKTTD